MAGFFKRHRKLLWIGGIGFVVLAGAAAVLIRPVLNGRCGRPHWSCINNLRQIDGAKEQWAMENQQTNGAPVVIAAVNEYIKGGEPKCTAGGTYIYGAVDEPPRCSIGKDHVLK
jgi:hypothetical protein